MRHLKPTSVPASLALLLLALLVAGCGGDGDDGGDDGPGTSATSSVSTDATASDSPSESASEPASEPPSDSGSTAPSGEDPSALACTPPDADLDLTAGTAVLDITDGPGLGSHPLSLDTGADHAYEADDGELEATFSDPAGHVLALDIEGLEACAPDAFVSIATGTGQTFIDPSHTQCVVAVTRFDATGIEGTVTCTGLSGGGEGVRIDASGTFSATS
jgi:hypothetical protein